MSNDIEEMVQTQVEAVMRRANAVTEKPSEITSAIKEIRDFTEVVTKLLDKPEVEVEPAVEITAPVTIPAPAPAAPSELTDLLREMKKFSSAVVDLLNKPEPPDVPDPAPIVNVAAPAVRVEVPTSFPAPRGWRFQVTKRDNTAQQRIQEIVVQPLE